MKSLRMAYWIATSFFCLWMLFTAYAQLTLPPVKEMFTHLGFPGYFCVELSIAKIVGVLVLLAPVPPRLKEWTYAGFAITLGSALIAHLSVGDSLAVYSWAGMAAAVLGLSYFLYRKTPADSPGLTSNVHLTAKGQLS